MHFKSLELMGFKSFADKTRIDFEPGVTAIVGPNGCGKSNVADAIRWVMGEQNARLLRGLKMEDIIFNGTDERKPLGFAEVSLTLTNEEGTIPLDCSEVTVSRRVFRSGEGQYLINRTPCRLKDIDDLFAGTGIGISAYSIIEQGKIDMILSSKPEDRRFIFEEAAGITRYKERKREAMRKLESTEENLLRLSDIIKEVKRQLGSVERQAARARRAQEVAENLKSLELKHGAHRRTEIDGRIRGAEENRDAMKERERGMESDLRVLEDEQESLRDALRALDQELGTVQARRMGVSGTIETHRSRIQADEKLIRELEESEALCAEEIAQLRALLQRVQEEEASLIAAVEKAAREHLDAVAELASIEGRLEGVRSELRSREAEANRLRTELIELINRTSQQRNELAGVRHGSRTSALRATRLQVEGRELLEKIELARGDTDSRRSRREGCDALRGAAARDLEKALADAQSARCDVAEIREELLRQEKALARAESRVSILERYARTYEGYARGVQLIMAEVRREDGVLRGVNGIVAEKIIPHEGYERAVEAALGDALQSVLTGTLDEACAAAAFLSGRAAGTFLPCDELAPVSDKASSPGPGTARRALECVRVDPAFTCAAHYLLNATLIVDELTDARRLISSCIPGTRVVTRSGELLVARGELRVSPGTTDQASPLLSRERELKEAGTEAERLRGEREGVRQRMEEGDARVARCEQLLTAAREAVSRADIAVAEARTEEVRASAVLEGLQSELCAARTEEGEIETARREATAKEGSLGSAITAAEERQREIEKALAGHQHELAAKTAVSEECLAIVTTIKVKAAAAAEKESGIRTHLEQIRRQREGSSGTLKNREEQLRKSALRREELIAEISSLHGEMETLIAQRETNESDVRQREERKAGMYGRQKEIDALLRERMDGVGKIKDELSQIEVSLAQQRGERGALIDRIREAYGEDITQMAADASVADWGGVAAQIQELKDKLARLGPVNMVALEEHDELAKRLAFLTEQEADLLNAKESLVKAINKMNAESTRMFAEAFEAIKGNFKEIFKDLFGGGGADLHLEEGASVLDAGINIVARTPGKKLQNISLLSGGEKALTAVALLFSIFKVRPSPFCVLDEIDAPLDESNINRFLALLEQFLKSSQFIIITHNKRTISMADVMYGITMEESGVSKVVSVKFAKGHKKHATEKHTGQITLERKGDPAPEIQAPVGEA
ncbi:MAG: chromosome segregation protein SMC [Candidatus Aureabacteria bacterium]|nr:chromosome segregation protein SMC [Candidatus Auribacterota bacterium]